MRFTHAWLDEINATKRSVWHDDGCQNLIVRIGTGERASKVFYWYGRAAGKPSFIKIGPYPKVPVTAARDEAKRLSGEVVSGRQPKARATIARDEMTVGKLFKWFLEFHAKPHKKTWREDQANFEKSITQWSSWNLSRLTKEVVKKHHVAMKSGATSERTKGGPYAANKMLELLGFMWRLAATELGIKAPDPTKGIKRFHRVERERYLSRTEIGRFLDALSSFPRETTRHFILLSLLTGARRANVAAMRWVDIDMTAGVWTIEAGDSKSKKVIKLVLPAPAMEILKYRKELGTSEWVLPGPGITGHIVEPKHAMRAILATAGITQFKKGRKRTIAIDVKNHVRFHDLRRTLGSWQAAQGTSMIVIGKSLGHTSTSATKVYARVDLDPVRESVALATAAMMATQNNSEKSSE